MTCTLTCVGAANRWRFPPNNLEPPARSILVHLDLDEPRADEQFAVLGRGEKPTAE